MSYKHVQGVFNTTNDQSSLFWQKWVSKKKETLGRHIVFIHGGLEHSDRYQHLINYFMNEGVSFYAFDLRGHGRSKRIHNEFGTIKVISEDVVSFLDFLADQHDVKYPLLLGHSLGGLIALKFALLKKNREKISGLFLSAPFLKIKFHMILFLKQLLAKYCLVYVCPRLKIHVGLDLRYLSHDKSVIQNYKNDPLVQTQFPVAFAMDIVRSGEFVISHANQIEDCPVFIAHGDTDGIASVEGSVEVFNQIKSKKKVTLYPEYYHELFNESESKRERVLSDFKKWVFDIWKFNS